MISETNIMIRFFDIFFSSIGLIFSFPILILLFIIGYLDTRSPLFFQVRVGKDRLPFTLVKFRTMKLDAISVATHLADADKVTPFGRFLRRTKLDELPQLWNVLKGDMSLVGPRPCLSSQFELIEERHIRNVFIAKPGITGLGQVRNVDMSIPEKLAILDAELIRTLSLSMYFLYIFQTLFGKGRGDNITIDT